MPIPAFSGGVGLDWWRIEDTTPPSFPLVGTTDGTTATIVAAQPFAPPIYPPPLVGQLVTGTGIPANATVVSVSTSSFVISANTTAAAFSTLQIGTEPVSLAEAKAWGIIDHADTDPLILDMITAARLMAEADLKRALITQCKTLYFASFPWNGFTALAIRGMGLNPWWFPSEQGIITLPYPMLQSIVSIQYLDVNNTLQTVSPSSYTYSANATPGKLMPSYGTVWPVARPQVDAVRIKFICGYGPNAYNVPMAVRMAMRQLVSSGYGSRDAYDPARWLKPTPLYNSLLQTENYGFYG